MSDPTHTRAARRGVFQRFAIVGLALVLPASGLAACGDDDDAQGATGGEGGGQASADVGPELADLLEVDPANAAKGEEFKLASVLALSGPGSFYGKTMSRGIDLAVKHIRAAGGPNIEVTYWDHKSGDAAASKQAITEIVARKFPAKMASYVDGLGAMLEGTATGKVFTLDGGGGTSVFGQGVPYFWGTRAITPNDTLAGLFRWFKETYPDKKTVGFTGWDVGDPSNSQIKEDVLEQIDDAGLEWNGLYELTPVGSQDYSAVLPKIKSNEPDLLLVGLYGQDPGSFVNQAVTAGLEAVRVGFEFTPDGVNSSKGSYDSQGWTFAYDYFDANNPISPLAKLFVREFEAEYGEKPDFYAANFYENTLVLWEVIRRVKAKGGDINSGEELNAALEEDLTVVSVYSGDEDTVGTYTFDPTTHSVLKREMGVFEYKGGDVTAKAFFNIGGEDYRNVQG